MQYFWFAERFGWPPDVVDAQPLRIIDRLPGVAEMHDQLREEREKAAREAQRT